MYAGEYDAVGVRIEIPNPIANGGCCHQLCHRTPWGFGDVVKGDNLCESGGLCIIRVGGVDLEG